MAKISIEVRSGTARFAVAVQAHNIERALDVVATRFPGNALRVQDLVRKTREEKKTVVLTTHYMEEAEELCDRVAIMDHGRVLVCDTPRALVRSRSRVLRPGDHQAPIGDRRQPSCALGVKEWRTDSHVGEAHARRAIRL